MAYKITLKVQSKKDVDSDLFGEVLMNRLLNCVNDVPQVGPFTYDMDDIPDFEEEDVE